MQKQLRSYLFFWVLFLPQLIFAQLDNNQTWLRIRIQHRVLQNKTLLHEVDSRWLLAPTQHNLSLYRVMLSAGGESLKRDMGFTTFYTETNTARRYANSARHEVRLFGGWRFFYPLKQDEWTWQNRFHGEYRHWIEPKKDLMAVRFRWLTALRWKLPQRLIFIEASNEWMIQGDIKKLNHIVYNQDRLGIRLLKQTEQTKSKQQWELGWMLIHQPIAAKMDTRQVVRIDRKSVV